MGTRADFYVGRGEQAEWLGSIAWDGYPDGIDSAILDASTEEVYRIAVAAFAARRDDWTSPEQGWPWPWEDSHTSDYGYCYDQGHVWYEDGNGYWAVAQKGRDVAVYPNMKHRQNVTLGPRSGVIVATSQGIITDLP